MPRYTLFWHVLEYGGENDLQLFGYEKKVLLKVKGFVSTKFDEDISILTLLLLGK